MPLVLERMFNGEVSAHCEARGDIGSRLRDIQGVDEVSRQRIVAHVKRAPATEVPAVLFVHGEGVISVGIRGLAGNVAWLS